MLNYNIQLLFCPQYNKLMNWKRKLYMKSKGKQKVIQKILRRGNEKHKVSIIGSPLEFISFATQYMWFIIDWNFFQRLSHLITAMKKGENFKTFFLYSSTSVYPKNKCVCSLLICLYMWSINCISFVMYNLIIWSY